MRTTYLYESNEADFKRGHSIKLPEGTLSIRYFYDPKTDENVWRVCCQLAVEPVDFFGAEVRTTAHDMVLHETMEAIVGEVARRLATVIAGHWLADPLYAEMKSFFDDKL